MPSFPHLVVACVLMLVAAASPAAPPPATVFIDDLTWTELRAAIASGKTTIIVPVGGTEQNGPHMTLGKHNARVTALAQKIAQALGNALVAPTLAYVPEGGINPPAAHMRFPGTITMPDATFEKVVEYAARSFKLHGFRDIVLIGDHGGYRKSLKAVAERLDREWAATPVRVHAINEYWVASETTFAQVLKRQGYRDDEIGTHAGLADTSLALAIDPRLVRADRLHSTTPLGPADGVYGDPTACDRGVGTSRRGPDDRHGIGRRDQARGRAALSTVEYHRGLGILMEHR
jgi:creatinine amidohydrolase/Fe(II)-dependent formamide hydrolase-like protein